MPHSFQLHIDGRLSSPLVEIDSITYGPLMVMKLEHGRTLSVRTGTWVAQCDRKGRVVIVPAPKWERILRFAENSYGPGDNQPIEVMVTNTTGDFIRIEPTDRLFKYTFVPIKVPEVPTKTTIAEEANTPEEVIPEALPVVEMSVPEENNTEEVATPQAPLVVEMPASKAKKARKPRVQKRIVI